MSKIALVLSDHTMRCGSIGVATSLSPPLLSLPHIGSSLEIYDPEVIHLRLENPDVATFGTLAIQVAGDGQVS
jgi:hypothetical protein